MNVDLDFEFGRPSGIARLAGVRLIVALGVSLLLVVPDLARASGLLPQTAQLELDGVVNDAISLPDGDLIIAGQFLRVNGVERRNLARINVDGTVDLDWKVDVEAGIVSMAVSANRLFFSGYFDHVDGMTRRGLAAVALDTAALLPWSPAASDVVEQVAANDHSVYLSGRFTEVDGVPRGGFAAVGIENGVVAPWQPGTNALASEIVATNSAVYICGGSPDFFAVDATTGSPLSFDLAVDGDVHDAALSPEGLWIAGDFREVNGVQRAAVALLDPASGAVRPWRGADVDADFLHLAVAQEAIFLSGDIRTSSDSIVHYFALSRSTGEATPWAPDVEVADDRIPAPNAWNSRVVLFGQVRASEVPLRRGLAVIDSATGALDPMVLDAARAGEGMALALDDEGNVFVGGRFTAVSSAPRMNLAKIRSDGSLDTAFRADSSQLLFGLYYGSGRLLIPVPGVAGLNRQVGLVDAASGDWIPWAPGTEVMEIHQGHLSQDTLFALGSAIIDGERRDGLFAIDLHTMAFKDWQAEGAPRASSVHAVGNRLYYAGYNEKTTGYRIHAIDLDSGALLASSAEIEPLVEEISHDDSGLYVRLGFQGAAEKPPERIVKLDLPSLSRLEWRLPDAFPHGDNVQSVAGDGDTVFATYFWDTGRCRYVCRLEAQSGAFTTQQDEFNFYAENTKAGAGLVAVAGAFDTVNGELRLGIARFESALFRGDFEQ